MNKHKGCNMEKWHMLICLAPLIAIALLKFAFPTLPYLSFLIILICPLSMGLMMIFMDRKEKHNYKNKVK